MRPRITITLALLLPAIAVAQDAAAIARRLAVPRLRAAALAELRALGGSGAAAVLAAAAAAPDDAAAEPFAAALADLGTATARVIPQLLAEVPRRREPVRSLLLRALANGTLLGDDDARGAIDAALPAWATAGLLYSPAADQPTFAWYEYVRLVRRMQLAARGPSAAALQQALDQLRADRSVFVAFGQAAADTSPYAIEAHGAHGQREILEAVAELAIDCPGDVAAITAELLHYLEQSPPRPPILRTEHCAGIGENAPNALPGAGWPTQWRYDAWHFACARAVLSRHPDPTARQLALRHLLFADTIDQRLQAIAAVRTWPEPRVAFAPELAACLGDADRRVVREALITAAQSRPLAQAIRPALRTLVDAGDAELSLLARQALADDH